MRLGAVTGSFEFSRFSGSGTIEVIDEDRTIAMADGKFEDTFESYQVHLYKLADILTGVHDGAEAGNAISSYELSQNYPNPFNGTTVIEYRIEKNAYVKIAIYDPPKKVVLLR